MDSKEIQELLKLVNRLELAEFKFREGDLAFSVKTKYYSKSRQGDTVSSYMPMASVTPASPVTHAPSSPVVENKSTAESDTENAGGSSSGAAKENLVEIRSPIVGTFYRSASPEKGPYVKARRQIGSGIGGVYRRSHETF